MKSQRGVIAFMGAAWLMTAGAIGSVSAADSPMKDQAFTDTGRLDWAALSSNTPAQQVARLDWTGLSGRIDVAQDAAPNAYMGTSLTITPAQGRLDWGSLSQ